jgi:hypothetical protein
MKALTVFIIVLALSLNAAGSDPCEGETDRFTCIEDLIANERALALARIAHLNTTQGSLGEVGDTGPKGNQGPRGEDREDVKADVTEKITASVDAWRVRYLALVRNSRLAPLREKADAFDAQLSNLQNRFSILNRNAALINTQSLHFPRTDYVNTLLSYRSVFNGQNCLVTPTAGGKQSTSSCSATAAADTIGWVCRDKYPPLSAVPTFSTHEPTLCGLVTAQNLTISLAELGTFGTGGIDASEYLVLPEKFTIVVSSIQERAAYKLGVDPQNPIYTRALDAILNELEDPNVESAILAAMVNVKAELDPEFVVYVENAMELLESLADPNAGLRRERLGGYIAESEILYYLLVTVVVELFTDYVNDPAFVATLSQAEIDAFEEMESSFLEFSTLFVNRWKELAIEERDAYSHSPFKYALATPAVNHVDNAAVRLAEEYEYEQSALLESIVADAVGGTVLALSMGTLITSGFVLGSAVGAGATVAASAGIGAALGAAGTVGGISILGAAGAAAIVAGPVAVLVGAITVGITLVIDLDKETKYKRIFDNLQAYNVTSITDLYNLGYSAPGGDDYSGQQIVANMMFAWLMVSAPKGIE